MAMICKNENFRVFASRYRNHVAIMVDRVNRAGCRQLLVMVQKKENQTLVTKAVVEMVW